MNRPLLYLYLSKSTVTVALSKTLFVAAVFLQPGDEPRAGHELVREQPRAVRLAQHQPQEGAAEGGWHCELRLELETKVHEIVRPFAFAS